MNGHYLKHVNVLCCQVSRCPMVTDGKRACRKGSGTSPFQRCKQDQIFKTKTKTAAYKTKTKTKVTRPRPRPPKVNKKAKFWRIWPLSKWTPLLIFTIVMFQTQNRETINSRPTWKVAVSLKIIMTTSVTRSCFTTSYQTCKIKTKTKTNFLVSDCPKTDGVRPHHCPIPRHCVYSAHILDIQHTGRGDVFLESEAERFWLKFNFNSGYVDAKYFQSFSAPCKLCSPPHTCGCWWAPHGAGSNPRWSLETRVSSRDV